MRILWYGKWEAVDGNHVYMRSLSRLQSRNGHHVFISFFGNERTNIQARDPSHQYLPLPFLYTSQPWTIHHPKANEAFMNYLTRSMPDVFHASLAVSSFDFCLSKILKKTALPWIVTFHISFSNHLDIYSFFSYTNYLLYRRILMSSDKVIVFSERQRQFMVKRLKMPIQCLEVIPNGVDRDLYCPGPSQFRKGLNADFVVGYLGRLAPEKRISILCKAFIDADIPKAKLLIIGDGISRGRLIRRYGGHPAIVFAGPVQDEKLKVDMIRAMDCFVMPSSIEGLSLSLLEAMSCAVTPVATEVGCHGDLIGDCGVCLKPVNVRIPLVRTLIKLSKEKELLFELGQKARKKIEASFCWVENLKRVNLLYSEISSKKRAIQLIP